MTRELNRLALAVLAGFLVVALSAGYWSVFQSQDMLAREDNPRRVIAEQALQRGAIVDRHGVVLADGPQGDRHYPHPGVEGAIGYYNYQFGAAGLEAGYNDILSGQTAEEDALATWWDQVLHRPASGLSLRSTIDLDIQQALHQRMQDLSGAAVMIHVPSGQVLAMVSHPSFDPNHISRYIREDANGDPIESIAPDSPLYNRVKQGGYQPGTSIHIPLLIGLLNNGFTLETPTPNAMRPIDLRTLDLPQGTLGCLSEPEANGNLTLLGAFAHNCPAPFVSALGEVLTPAQYQELITQLGLIEAPLLLAVETGIALTPAPLTEPASEVEHQARLLHAALGQDQLTLNPLQMARIIAAITNQGNVPPFHLADAYRLENNGEWLPLSIPRRQPAILLPETARQLRQALLVTAQTSPLVQTAQRTDFTIRNYQLHGHVATAFAGEGLVSWFNGFIDLGNGQAIMIVVVIEDAATPEIAAEIAGDALQAAVLALEEEWATTSAP